MNSGFADRRKEVESALLDYHQSPGKYPVLLRRPAVVFSSLREVLQLASGRLPDGAAAPSPAVQRAAGFFVRSALLHPGADHYTLLGLERSADAAAIKERYRQMMRLMHPDFAEAAGGGSWPADAASRINQAYEVLASSVQRRDYDALLDSAAGAGPGAGPAQRPGPGASAHLRATAASAPAQDPRARLKRIAGAFGALGTVALGASLLAAGPPSESLVQRTAPRESPAPLVPLVPAEAKIIPLFPPAQPQAALQPADAADTSPPPQQVAAVPPVLTPAPAPVPAMLESSPRFSPLARQAAPVAQPEPAHARLPTAASGNSGRAFAAALPAMIAPAAFAGPPVQAAQSVQTVQTMQPAQPMQTTQAVPAAQAAPAVPAAQVPPAAAAAAPAAPPPRPAPANAVSLTEAHTLLSKLLQQMEAGSGERLLAGLDRSVRNTPAAQALLRQYNSLVEGARTVKVGNLQLKAEPRDERLVVTGHVVLDIGEYSAARSRELPLQAEFAKRGGTVVMTRLAPGAGFAEPANKADPQ